MPFMPFNILGIWLRGLLSLAIPILAIFCLKWWYDESRVVEPNGSRPRGVGGAGRGEDDGGEGARPGGGRRRSRGRRRCAGRSTPSTDRPPRVPLRARLEPARPPSWPPRSRCWPGPSRAAGSVGADLAACRICAGHGRRYAARAGALQIAREGGGDRSRLAVGRGPDRRRGAAARAAPRAADRQGVSHPTARRQRAAGRDLRARRRPAAGAHPRLGGQLRRVVLPEAAPRRPLPPDRLGPGGAGRIPGSPTTATTAWRSWPPTWRRSWRWPATGPPCWSATASGG